MVRASVIRMNQLQGIRKRTRWRALNLRWLRRFFSWMRFRRISSCSASVISRPSDRACATDRSASQPHRALLELLTSADCNLIVSQGFCPDYTNAGGYLSWMW